MDAGGHGTHRAWRMGVTEGARYDGKVRRYFTPRCVGMHVTLVLVLPLFAWLTWWQFQRAEGGNTLSWAYVCLWPAFGIYAVYTWWQLIHDQAARSQVAGGTPVDPGATSDPSDTPVVDPSTRPPGWALTGGRKKNIAIAATAPIDAERGGRGERFTAQTSEEADRLAAYNRYLAALDTGDREATSTDAGASS
jgi:hypothetical protein